MSFITKRERVFNESDLPEVLPPRNEGKLKTFSSCVDTRAWSHFSSDNAEHLTNIIKKNNDTCVPKLLSTKVIVETLMASKNAEVVKMKRKITMLDQMLAAYDELELNCSQKYEITKAHEAIKMAFKDLETCFHLDLSNFTEAGDSEVFQTGKTRDTESDFYHGGDSDSSSALGDWSGASEGVSGVKLVEGPCKCDQGTYTVDPRLQELRDIIIKKDAKIIAMNNIKAVLENDICEPYCIYAHIYTALEKILGILSRNVEYKIKLDKLTKSTDIRGADIIGKILYKLKILEKFGTSLLYDCSCDAKFAQFNYQTEHVSCTTNSLNQKTEVIATLPTDSRRANLVANLLDHNEMKDFLSKKVNNENVVDDTFLEQDAKLEIIEIEKDNLKRLKDLQTNYDDLVKCHEDLKLEKQRLQDRCNRYNEVKVELDDVRAQLREYSVLWNEKEYYRRRSDNLDELKEKYLVLAAEASNYETELNAKNQINNNRAQTIEQLKHDNLNLQERLNTVTASFEKEKTALQCQLKDAECKIMCLEEQIQKLSLQLNRVLDQDRDKSNEDNQDTLILLTEIETLKEQSKNVTDLLCCSEEEKENLLQNYEMQLNLINELKLEIEDWKRSYENAVNKCECIEKIMEKERDEINLKLNKNQTLIEDQENIIGDKSLEINKLSEALAKKDQENLTLTNQIEKLQKNNKDFMDSHKLMEKQSNEILYKIRDCDEQLSRQKELTREYQEQLEKLQESTKELHFENNVLKNELEQKIRDNQELKSNLAQMQCNVSNKDEIIKNVQDELNHLKEIQRSESRNSQNIVTDNLQISNKLQRIISAHENALEIIESKEDFTKRIQDIENTLTLDLSSNKSESSLAKRKQENESIRRELQNLSDSYQRFLKDNYELQQKISDKNRALQELLNLTVTIEKENREIVNKVDQIPMLQEQISVMHSSLNDIINENKLLKSHIDGKTEELNELKEILTSISKEKDSLLKELDESKSVKESYKTLEKEHSHSTLSLQNLRKENEILKSKLKHEDSIILDYNSLKQQYEQIKNIHEQVLSDYNATLLKLNETQNENVELNQSNRDILANNASLEKALIEARKELLRNAESTNTPYADLVADIEEIKKEKQMFYNKYRDLQDKLDDAEQIIQNISEDLTTRNDTITILKSHINELESEVAKLNETLKDAVIIGEELQDHSNRQTNDKLQNMAARHLKATQNMKMDLMKLQNDKLLLEEQLSIHKMRQEECMKSSSVASSNLKEISSALRQLELETLGKSSLSIANFTKEELINTINNIRFSKELSLKSADLEETLMKFQKSSEMIFHKTEEAKELAEKEMTKIICEKEEAEKEKICLENLVANLTESLKAQKQKEEAKIKDMQLEINNLNIFITNLSKKNESLSKNISELEEKLQTLHNLYSNIVEQNSELQTSNVHQSDIINRTNILLSQKNAELDSLKNELHKIKSKILNHITTQTDANLDKTNHSQNLSTKNDAKSNHENVKHQTPESIFPRHTPPETNEVQILTASIQSSSFEFIKKSYLKYKVKQLSTGSVEQHSIELSNELGSHFSHFLENDIYQRQINESVKEMEPISSETTYQQTSERKEKKSSELLNNNTKTESISTNHTVVERIFLPDLKINPKYQESSSENKQSTELTINSNNLKSEVEDHLFGMPYDTEYGVNAINYVLETKLKKTDALQNIDVADLSHSESNLNKYPDTILSSSKSSLKIKNYTNRYTPHISISKSETDMQRHKNDKTELQRKVSEDLRNIILFDKISLENIKNEKSNKNSLVKNLGLPIRTENTKEITTGAVGIENLITESNSMIVDGLFANKNNTISFQNASNTFKALNPNNMDLSETDGIDSKSSKPFENDLSDHSKLRNLDNRQSKKNTAGQQSSINEIHSVVHIKESIQSFFGDRNQYFISYSHNNDFIIDPVNIDKNGELDKTAIYKHSGKKYSSLGDLDGSNLNKTHQILHSNNDLLNIKDAQYTSSTTETDDFALGNHTNGSSSQRDTHYFSSTKATDYGSSTKLIDYDTNLNKTENTSGSESFGFHGKVKDFSTKQIKEKGVMAQSESVEEYEKQIYNLNKKIQDMDRKAKMKEKALKAQYETSMKKLFNEHNKGVMSMQSLHEETMHDLIKFNESEIENLRSLSSEAMLKADQMEKEYKVLKHKVKEFSLDKEPVKIQSEFFKRRHDIKLSVTEVEAIDVKPKTVLSPCTCSAEVAVSDKIRSMFEDMDLKGKASENAYLNFIMNKISSGSLDTLDAQELTFLHLKVCRSWKHKLHREESLQRRIVSLEAELMKKQKNAQEYIAELDRKVAEERRRLQEVREAVCPCNEAPVKIDSSNQMQPDSNEFLCLMPPVNHVQVYNKDAGCNVNERGFCSPRCARDHTVPRPRPETSEIAKFAKRRNDNKALLPKMESDSLNRRRSNPQDVLSRHYKEIRVPLVNQSTESRRKKSK